MSRKPRGRSPQYRLPVLAAIGFLLYAVTATRPFVRTVIAYSAWFELGLLVSQAALLLLLALWYERRGGPDAPDLGMSAPPPVRALVFFSSGALVAAGAVLAGYFGAELAGMASGHLQSAERQQQQIASLQVRYGSLWWSAVLVYGFFSPLAEELLFRGLMVTNWRKATGPVTACLLSAVVSALVHVVIYGIPWGAFAFLAVLHGLLAAVYVRTGSLWLTLALHVGANVGIAGSSALIFVAS